MTKDRYLIFTELEACNELGNQYAFFNLFKAQVSDTRPDLAEKSFSFTLGDDAEIILQKLGQTRCEAYHEPR
ncbi:hypothetical protein AO390_19810 [Pseudomonas marginalis ICMP 11289]|nr:hypothetical protein AO390_19810 [Pseudomonas marginalis ICMP 11289]